MKKKRESKWSEWMTLEEALVHVAKVQQCSRDEAWKQLRVALISGALPARGEVVDLPEDLPDELRLQ